MHTKNLFNLLLFCLFNIICLNAGAKSDIAQPFEVNGIYYIVIDTDKTDVKVTRPYTVPSDWSSHYSGIVSSPSTVTYNGTTYTVTEMDGGSSDRSAFGGQMNMTTVIIPETVVTIDKLAFGGCKGLKSVVFKPNSNLLSIGAQAFNSCTALTSITFPNSLTYIGKEAFRDE